MTDTRPPDPRTYIGRYELELNVTPEMTFLNYWDWREGDDVVCEMSTDGTLLLHEENSKRLISFAEFVALVNQREP